MTMDFREMNRRVFDGRPLPHVFFQPRFEPWHVWHQTVGAMPQCYEGMTIPQLYDYVDASMRTVHYYTGQPDPIERHFDDTVKTRSMQAVDHNMHTIDTPYGELVAKSERTIDNTSRQVRFPVRTRDDLIKLRWLYQHTTWRFNAEKFEQGNRFVGPRGEAGFCVPKSPYQTLAQQWMKLEDLIFALADFPDVVEDTMKAIDDSYDGLYEELTSYPNLKILNFGENIHEQLLSPAYWERYLMPFYTKRCDQLHAAGIFTHVHIDGYFRHMLPYVRHLPQHGVEALTPVPQGDMTLEEIAEHIGQKILLDGIPAVYFLDTFARDELMACVEQVVRLFHPRLVLGVSDEVPEGAGEEAIERVRMIGAWCRRHGRPIESG